ncbi:Crp/Fnr family transcriptional regulator [Enterocloster clostridioformis]|jgi:CRP-like cAMP-binding protein|uniref:Crp/Fnr family transcriptional regulator n=1 Tax=Enterocloster clostridioformis TaxID=1531 RepID=A0A2X2UFQ2_9FIRM|nr:Crp/Fnr family transcriptional regulator [Enterocloster clostridioformis]MCA5577680.1 Crp/Fnr family transcriptional regulator [Enterocloster clostridioformis]SQB10765.1 Crp/Fnr family transcriptional regulator [Enterocloster clostridioformis]
MIWEQILEDCKQYDCYPSVKSFFSTCPPLIRNYLSVCAFLPGQILTKAGTPCSTVYILISGRLQTIEEKAGEMPYSFFDLVPFDVLGDYELFSEDAESFVTVQVREPSVCLTLPARFYLQWISTDSTALFFRTKLLMKQLSRQLISNRRFLLMTYEERCMYIICQEARRSLMANGSCRFKLNRELLAAKTGCSLRTIHRLMKELEEKELIGLTGGRVNVTHGQLTRLLKLLDAPL